MEKTNLIIVGNGFDIQCKLKSTYGDFLEFKKKESFINFNELFNFIEFDEFERFNTNIRTYSNNQKSTFIRKEISDNLSKILDSRNIKINAWDIIFTFCFSKFNSANDVKWIDIEEYIKQFIHNSELLDSKGVNYLFEYVIDDNIICLKNENLRVFKIATIIKRIFMESSDKIFFIKSKKQLGQSFQSKKVIDFNKFLLLELNRFENEYRIYLFQEQNKVNSKYNFLADQLFEKIIYRDNLNSNFILSFNYTLPYTKTNNNCINIHGYVGESLEDDSNEIIFGFDQSNVIFDKTNYMFTKTYRKLHHRCTLREQNLPARKTVNRIKFFGHSIGEGDYSYFYSIFDYYDIYNNDIEIEFVYCFFKGKEPDEIMFDLQSNIAKLFHSYGDAMYKDGHGKNLIHKLLLEKRLSLRLIEGFD